MKDYHKYRHKIFILLTILLLLFCTLFIVSIINPEFQLVDIGLKNTIQSKVTAIFSFLSICLILYDMKKI